MVDGGVDDEDGGVDVRTELFGAGDVEIPTGSAKHSGPWLARRRLGPRLAFCCGAVVGVATVVVAIVSATGVIWCVAPWRCRPRTVVMAFEAGRSINFVEGRCR